MAKPKVKVLVEVFTDKSINVWADKLNTNELLSIEGICEVYGKVSDVFVTCDPRYDVEEIAQEIRNLLTAEVPEVFRE